MFHASRSLLPATIIACLAACSGNAPSPVSIHSVLAPGTVMNGACSYTGDPSQPSLTHGEVDLMFPLASYSPMFLFENQYAPSFNPDTETDGQAGDVYVTSATTRVTDTNGNDLPTMFDALCETGDEAACQTSHAFADAALQGVSAPLSTAVVAPGSTSMPSYGIRPIPVLDGAMLAALRSYFGLKLAMEEADVLRVSLSLVTYTSVSAEDLEDDTHFNSAEFEFPVTVTFGALASNLEDSGDTGLCVRKAAVDTEGSTCIGGQDAPSIAPPSSLVPACPGAS